MMQTRFSAYLRLSAVLAIVAIVLCCMNAKVAASTLTQEDAPRGMNGMATRATAKYLSLERELHQAIAEHNTATIEKLLDSEFELRTPTSPDSISGKDWLSVEINKMPNQGQIEQLSVYETESVSLVSYLYKTTTIKAGKKISRVYFIVDVWQQSTDKLLIRYFNVPANAIRFAPRPDGRE